MASSSVYDVDDDVIRFFSLLLPGLMNNNALVHNWKKRKITQAKSQRKIRKIDGKIGRTWRQRSRGQLRPTDFTWWRLIHQADIADPKSKNGKVLTFLSL